MKCDALQRVQSLDELALAMEAEQELLDRSITASLATYTKSDNVVAVFPPSTREIMWFRARSDFFRNTLRPNAGVLPLAYTFVRDGNPEAFLYPYVDYRDMTMTVLHLFGQNRECIMALLHALIADAVALGVTKLTLWTDGGAWTWIADDARLKQFCSLHTRTKDSIPSLLVFKDRIAKALNLNDLDPFDIDWRMNEKYCWV